MLPGDTLDPLQSDRFVWRWSADGTYSASSAYRAFFAGSTALLGARELWKARPPPRVKFFAWLALHNRLWTADRRRRHGLQTSDTCALCDQAPETAQHLLLGCVITRTLWAAMLLPLGLQSCVSEHSESVASWWLRQRARLDSSARPMFDSIFLLLSWIVWKKRNEITFSRGLPRSTTQQFMVVEAEAEDWVSIGYQSFAVPSAL